MTEPTVENAGSSFLVRALTDDDWPAAKALDAAAFGYEPDDDFLDTISLPAQDLRRFIGAFDPALESRLVGIAAIQSRTITYPGGSAFPVAAVTWVGVRPDQQRRGILRRLMKAQLHELHDSGGEPIAILTASEGGIYGRFGYGLSSRTASIELPAPTLLRGELSIEPVLEMPLAEALPLMKEIYARVRPAFVGHLDRTDAIWTSLHNEHPFTKKGNPRRTAIHPDGYIVYRLADSWTERGPDYTLTVVELCATTPVARASLWQHVLRYPLIRKVVFRKAWEDEPLAEMLDNPRILASELGDHVWTRLVDLSRAVEQRAYSATADVVVKVSDRFCPWNDNTWQLHLSNNGGSATPSVDRAGIELDIVDLGAAFLGGTRIARLAAAGRVTGTPQAIDELDAAMGTPLRPWTAEGF